MDEKGRPQIDEYSRGSCEGSSSNIIRPDGVMGLIGRQSPGAPPGRSRRMRRASYKFEGVFLTHT